MTYRWCKLGLCALAVVGALCAYAQVKTDDALRGTQPGARDVEPKPAAPKPSAVPQPAQQATPEPKKTELACRKLPGGCTSRFKPVAEHLVPEWFAGQEKNPTEARATRDKAIAYLKRYHETLIEGGGEINDVGRAYAFFVAVVYIAYANGRGPDRNQFRSLVKRCQKELAEDPKFQSYSDRDKQFVYERMILIAMDNEAALAHARQIRNRDLEAQHQKRAKAWLEDVTERPIDKVPSMWQ